MDMKKTALATGMIVLCGTWQACAQNPIPAMQAKNDFGGELIENISDFVPTSDDYTLEVGCKAENTLNIAFAGITYSPHSDATVRFVQKDGKVYIFENKSLKKIEEPTLEYTVDGENIIRNPSFEDVSEELSEGRWIAAHWDTWTGGTPAWGSETGYTNVRENADYRSDGAKSIIMHSNARALMQNIDQGKLEADSYYLLTYDYWTSEGWGNGDITYSILLGGNALTNDIMQIDGHTTPSEGKAGGSFTAIFRTPQDIPSEVWLTLSRNESKVDWLDNFNMQKIIPPKKGLTGCTDAKYLAGEAYIPENAELGEGYYIDMTEDIANKGFDNGTDGWTITAAGSKISTAEKAGGLIAGSQNHLQFWVGSGGTHGTLSQSLTELPNGRYTLKAAIVSSFSGNVSLFANMGRTDVKSGSNKVYATEGVVFDGTLEIGIDMETSGSPTIDIDEFRLYYHGIDEESTRETLLSKISEAKADTAEINRHSEDEPGYNNLIQYESALAYAEESLAGGTETMMKAIGMLDKAIGERENILTSYSTLSDAIAELERAASATKYPDLDETYLTIEKAREMFGGGEDMRNAINGMVGQLNAHLDMLNGYAELEEAIKNAEQMLADTDYPGKDDFKDIIQNAKDIYYSPHGHDMNGTISMLHDAELEYYDSQFVDEPYEQTVSTVDTSLEGAEKFVLRVDGKPFYMTNIQVRLDKLYGYEGWNDEEMEAVMKRASDDGFNTVSIPVHWREIEPVKDRFDWRILDKYMEWCRKYGMKMELLWFSWSSGGRVQYLWNYGGRKELRTPDYVCSQDGKSEFNMLRKEWEYSLDWRDKNLMEREKYVVSRMMEHIALWDFNNGSPHTVIGIQLGNEARGHGGNTASAAEIIDYYSYVGEAVKSSKYKIWTRLNCVSYETSGRIDANEKKRSGGGTNIDFVGIDIYGTSTSSILGNMGGQLPQKGKNYSMIMECDAKDSRSPYYQIAALAGNKAFDYYNMAVVDGNCLYSNNGHKLVEREHIEKVRQRNKMLNLANQEIALKAHGKSMYVYNANANVTGSQAGLDGIEFSPYGTSQAICIKTCENTYLLLSTDRGTFTTPSDMFIQTAESGCTDKDGNWIKENDYAHGNHSVAFTRTQCIRITTSDTALSVGDIQSEKNGGIEYTIRNGAILSDNEIYDIRGTRVESGAKVAKGVYIISNGSKSEKVHVR